ncbi:YybH family protein [Deinococcus hopiensis]|uniref:YybH family protein n=1 Tax=Deinococcus hopiensis TaxID=309885 RepID=UPI000A04D2FE|nr:DUF4440 domain-containing protein [Deinococcus hopiensis]
MRENLQGLQGLDGTVTARNIHAFVSGDTALLRAHWELTTTGADGKPLHLEGHTAEVVQRQPGGHWLYVVDHPFGAGPL